MKNKAILTLILSYVAVIGGLIMNFQEFLMGHPATIKNLIVTLVYLTLWILILTIGIKIKNREVMKYCSVFWIITLFFAIITTYVNVTGATVNWALPFVALLLGQFYGITFFVKSLLTSSILITFISLVMVITTVISLKYTKQV